MGEGVGYGRISEREYADRIAAIYTRLADEMAAGTSEEDAGRRARDAELNATIDLRLGKDFPNDRRATLRAVMDETEAARERLGDEFSSGRLAPGEVAAKAQALAAQLRLNLSQVLSPAEFIAFLGEGELPFPVDE